MTDERFRQITSYMRHMPLEHALRWCDSGACACLGCANGSGGLAKRGVTYDEWCDWWARSVEHIVELASDEPPDMDHTFV